MFWVEGARLLEEIFHELNNLHFQGELPLPKLSWNSRLSSTAGRFCPGSRVLLAERPAEIEVATYLREIQDGEMHIRDTLLHEMIHYLLWQRKRPHGHTAEFHQIMRRVGAKRYNPVPKLRPVKYWYECPACLERIPARKRMGVIACAPCCERFNRGKYHERFRLKIIAPQGLLPAEEKVPACEARENTAPPATLVASEKRLSPGEIIRRLEELKLLVTGKMKAPSTKG